MATFSENLISIVNGKGTKAEKVQTMVCMGLTPNEADVFYRLNHKNVRIQHRETYQYTFGVEIECLFMPNQTYSALQQLGVGYKADMGYHHTNGNKCFEFKRDGSLHGNDNSAHRPIEMVSPVLKGGKGFGQLEKACKALNEGDARVNKTCGLHVHIGVERLSDEAYVNIFRNYQMLESVIDSFMAESRRKNNNTYCKSIKNIDFSACRTKEDVAVAMSRNRYYKVNAMSYRMHRTIEFRQHQGTTNFEKIKMWVNFCAKLVEFSRSNVILDRVYDIDSIPFLTPTEKRFYKARHNELNNQR